MDHISFLKYFTVERVRGQDENHIYKNYQADLPRINVDLFLNMVFQNQNIKNKNDTKSLEIRQFGNLIYSIKDLDLSCKLYSKSLRYASYNGENYATVLGNRSAVFFSLQDYENCLKDIDLCLKGKCVDTSRPKILLRKAKCLLILGRITDMKAVLNELIDFINKKPQLPKNISEMYNKHANQMLQTDATDKEYQEPNDVKIPTLETNSKFLNASNAVALRYNKQLGRHVVAKQDIPQGQVLFVEKAYIFSLLQKKSFKKAYCQFCLIQVKSFVPCILCTRFVFCSENCRDLAWKEFHQWECFAIRSGLFLATKDNVAFRIVMKAAHSSFHVKTTDYKQDIAKYGDKDNMYTAVHGLCTHFDNMTKECAMKNAAAALVIVHYLIQKTDFFTWLKKRPEFSHVSQRDLCNRVGALFLRHMAQYPCNILEAKGFDEDQICRYDVGAAILPSTCMMSHSCMPNSSLYFIGNTAVVKAIRKINANERISYAYMGLYHHICLKVERQNLLAMACNFECRCEACINPEWETAESYLCLRCKNAAPVISKEGMLIKPQCLCSTCKHKFVLPDHVQITEKIAAKYLDRFVLNHNLVDAKRCLKLAKEIVASDHPLLSNIYLELSSYFIHQEADLKNFMKYVKILVRNTQKRYGNVAFENGIFIVQMSTKLYRVLNKSSLKGLGSVIKDAKELLQEAKLIFNLYHPAFIDQIEKMEKCFIDKEIEINEVRNKADSVRRYFDDSYEVIDDLNDYSE